MTTVTETKTYRLKKPLATFSHSHMLVRGQEFFITRGHGELIYALSMAQVLMRHGIVASGETHLGPNHYFDVFAEMAQEYSMPLEVWLPNQGFPRDAVRFRIVGEEEGCLIIEVIKRRST